MDIFHIVFDTSLLRQTPFGHPSFARLLRRVQQGFAKLYIPEIALEERRTQLLDDYDHVVEAATTKLRELKRGQLGMITSGLFELDLRLPSREDVDQHSTEILARYLAGHKIEVLSYTFEHANKAWDRYFRTKLPFNPNEKRENRRRDIPDAWILEAALDIKTKSGRHCVLIKDNKLEAALMEAGIEVWNEIDQLDAEIETATAIVPIVPTVQVAPSAPAVPLDPVNISLSD